MSPARVLRYGERTSRNSMRIKWKRARTWAVDYLAFFCVVLIATSTEGSFFKRRGAHFGSGGGKGSKGSKGKGKIGGNDKVKQDVAWLLEDKGGEVWQPVSDDGHVKVWKRSMPGSDFLAIKSSAILEASPQALFEVLTPGDIDIVRQYNPLAEEGKDLEVIDRDNKVSWSATVGIWPCRPRDFVTRIRRATFDDGSVAIVNSATTHPKAPEKGKYIRGEILHGMFHIKPAKNKNQSEFTMVHHFNPGGNVPAWLMNWLAEGKPMAFVRRLEEVAVKWDQQAASNKKMSCKGRGFGDKPCAFLLLSEDDIQDANNAVAAVEAWAQWSYREWLALLATLAATALACYCWTLGRSVRSRVVKTPFPEVKENGPEGGNGAPTEVGIESTPTPFDRKDCGDEGHSSETPVNNLAVGNVTGDKNIVGTPEMEASRSSGHRVGGVEAGSEGEVTGEASDGESSNGVTTSENVTSDEELAVDERPAIGEVSMRSEVAVDLGVGDGDTAETASASKACQSGVSNGDASDEELSNEDTPRAASEEGVHTKGEQGSAIDACIGDVAEGDTPLTASSNEEVDKGVVLINDVSNGVRVHEENSNEKASTENIMFDKVMPTNSEVVIGEVVHGTWPGGKMTADGEEITGETSDGRVIDGVVTKASMAVADG